MRYAPCLQDKGKIKHFIFSFEVLSTKLNYHEHWRSILEDIEREYRMLSLDYMKRTYHGFSPENGDTRTEIVWWSIFPKNKRSSYVPVRI